MTYEQRSELRKECSRFLRFSYLIDFIGLESLRTIYQESVQELLVSFEDLVQCQDMVVYKEKNQRPQGKQPEPMCRFYLGFICKWSRTSTTLTTDSSNTRRSLSSCPRPSGK